MTLEQSVKLLKSAAIYRHHHQNEYRKRTEDIAVVPYASSNHRKDQKVINRANRCTYKAQQFDYFIETTNY